MTNKVNTEPDFEAKKAWLNESHISKGLDVAADGAKNVNGVAKIKASRDDETLLFEAIIQPPDGGWAWMIVAAAFTSNMIDGACVFNTGHIFLPSWIEYFNASPSAVSWVTAVMSAWYFLGGPVSSAISNTFGFRVVGFVGATLTCSGFLISVFAPSLSFLCFSYGFLIGLGFGFLFLPTVVVISFYFKQRRALALGIAACGTGVGQLVFAPVLKLLHSYHSWQEMCILMAGIAMHCYVCTTFYRPLRPTAQQVKKVEEVLAASGVGKPNVWNAATTNQKPAVLETSFSRASSISSASSVFCSESPSVANSAATSPNPARRRRIHSITVPDTNFVTRTVSVDLDAEPGAFKDRRSLYRLSQVSIKTINRPLNRMDIFSESFHGHRNNMSAAMDRPVLEKQELVDVLKPEDTWQTLRSSLRQIFDLKLFGNPTFLAWVFGGALMSFGFFVPFTYLPMYATLVGHAPRDASFLVSIIGVVNIFARVLAGWLADRPHVDAIVVQNVSILLGGIATLLLPHFSQYWLLVIYCICFGIACACYTSLRSIVCVQLLGLNNLTTATGWIFLFLGAANIAGSPTVAFLYDYTGSFQISFYITGSLMIMSAVIGFSWRKISSWDQKREKRTRKARRKIGPEVCTDLNASKTLPETEELS